MIKKKSLSIINQFIVAIVSLVSIVFTAFSFSMGFFNYWKETSALKSHRENLMSISELNLSESLWKFDQEAIETTMTALCQNPDIEAVKVVDKTSFILSERICKEGLETKPKMFYTRDIYAHGNKLGHFEIRFFQYSIFHQHMYDSLIIILATFFLIGILSFLIWYLGLKLVKEPIQALKKMAKQLAKGELYTNIVVSRKDEIGELAQIFSDMRDAIKQKIDLIEQNNLHLECLVKERTTQLEKALAESESQLRHAIEEAPIPIMLHAEDGEVIKISDVWTEKTGYKQSDIPTINLWTEKAYGVKQKEIKTAIDSLYYIKKRQHDGEYTVATKNGLQIWDFYSAYIGKTKDGRKIAMSVAIDITERKKAEEGMLKANMAKTQFLANMSHEIRTPMNGIMGFLSILTDKEDDKDKKEMLKLMALSADNLLEIVNNILDISKIEAGKMNIHEIDFDIKEMLGIVHELFRKSLDEKQLDFLIEIDEDIPRILHGDSVKIGQILTNLINNAIKFTEKGKIEVIVKMITEESESYVIEISVKDTGIGIAEDMLEKVFEEFVQGEHYLTKKYKGTGLGLSLSKRIAEMLGGSIRVESKINQGSCFILVIQLGKTTSVKKVEIAKGEIKMENRVEARRSILVVDDSDISQKLMSKILNTEFFNVDFAENGKAGVAKAIEKHYDLIFMDVQMPVMNGLDAAKIIHEHSVKMNNKTLIIGLSAFAMKEDKERALACGMDDYITKPVTKSILFEKLAKWGYFTSP